MGISFGNTGVTPYVGSKEVTEAYVGSQLVYTGKPPYNYAFLGGENKYFLANWVALTEHIKDYPATCTVVKDNGIFRISSDAGQYGSFVIKDVPNKTLKFIARVAGAGTVVSAFRVYYTAAAPSTATPNWSQLQNFNVNASTEYALFTVNIPTNARQVAIASGYNQTWFDAIRFEET